LADRTILADQGAEIADGIFGFELEMGGQDLAGSVILKTDEGELGGWRRPSSQSWRLASVSGIMPKRGRGKRRGAVLARPTLLRRGRLGARCS
jgi:hypothetical protein